MDVQDYEYYDARAKDVKLEDITSSQHNADILAMLRDNDPDIRCISIADMLEDFGADFVVREGNNLGWLGYFVGRNKQLEGLSIENFPDHLNIDAFLRGLGYNRSIQNLRISTDLGESSQTLVPFLRNNNSLRDLTLIGFNIGLQCARHIASLLGLGDCSNIEHTAANRRAEFVLEQQYWQKWLRSTGECVEGDAKPQLGDPRPWT